MQNHEQKGITRFPFIAVGLTETIPAIAVRYLTLLFVALNPFPAQSPRRAEELAGWQ